MNVPSMGDMHAEGTMVEWLKDVETMQQKMKLLQLLKQIKLVLIYVHLLVVPSLKYLQR